MNDRWHLQTGDERTVGGAGAVGTRNMRQDLATDQSCYPRPAPGIYSVPHEIMRQAVPPAYLALGIAYSAALVSNLLLPKWGMFIATAFYLILTITWVIALADLAQGLITHHKLKRFRVFSIFLVGFALAHGWVVYTIAYWSTTPATPVAGSRPENPPDDLVFLISPKDENGNVIRREIPPPIVADALNTSEGTPDPRVASLVAQALGESFPVIFVTDLSDGTTDSGFSTLAVRDFQNFDLPLIFPNATVIEETATIITDSASSDLAEETTEELIPTTRMIIPLSENIIGDETTSFASMPTDLIVELDSPTASVFTASASVDETTSPKSAAATTTVLPSTSTVSASMVTPSTQPIAVIPGISPSAYLAAPSGVSARALVPTHHHRSSRMEYVNPETVITMRIVALLVASQVLPWLVLGIYGYMLATKLDLECPICQG